MLDLDDDTTTQRGLKAEDADRLASKYMLRGESRMTSAEIRALGEHTGTALAQANEGFYLAPSTFAKECVYKIKSLNPLRANGARVFPNVGREFTIPVSLTGPTATALVRGNTTTQGAIAIEANETNPTFSLPVATSTSIKLYPKPRTIQIKVSRELLDDTSEENGVHLERLLADMAAQEFAELETTETFLGAAPASASTEFLATTIGLVPQLVAASRVNATAFGVAAASLSGIELTSVIEAMTSGRYARSIWIVRPTLLAMFDLNVYTGMLSTARPGSNNLAPCLHLCGRPLIMEPKVNTAAFATGVQGVLVDPTAFVYAESGPSVMWRRLDELKAETNEVVFQAIRRYDFILTDPNAGYAIKC